MSFLTSPLQCTPEHNSMAGWTAAGGFQGEGRHNLNHGWSWLKRRDWQPRLPALKEKQKQRFAVTVPLARASRVNLSQHAAVP